MKKFILILLAAVMTVSFSACSSSESSNGETASAPQLEKAIKMANKALPQMLGNGMKMTSIKYEDGNMVYTIECMEVTLGRDFIQTLEENKAEMKANMLASLEGGDANMKKVVNLCKEEKANVIYRFVGKPSKKSMEIEIPYDEL